jgi:hypothetical protein
MPTSNDSSLIPIKPKAKKVLYGYHAIILYTTKVNTLKTVQSQSSVSVTTTQQVFTYGVLLLLMVEN